MIRVPAKYRNYVEAELRRIRLECELDARERAGDRVLPRLVPDMEYNAEAEGDLIVLAVPPETPVVSLRSVA